MKKARFFLPEQVEFVRYTRYDKVNLMALSRVLPGFEPSPIIFLGHDEKGALDAWY